VSLVLLSGCGAEPAAEPVEAALEQPVEQEVRTAFAASEAELAATPADGSMESPMDLTRGGDNRQRRETAASETQPAPPPESPAALASFPQNQSGDPAKEDASGPVGDDAPAARIAADREVRRAPSASREGTDEGLENAASQPAAPNKLVDPSRAEAAGKQGPEDFRDWPQPEVALFVTGDQHGYFEPCGCTGLENQKGGMARRFTFTEQLRERGWNVVPVDAGNQIRRIGQQAAIKFEKTANALAQMDYASVGFGPGDMRLSATDLISVTYAESPEDARFVSANLTLLDPELLPTHKVVRQGQWRIGISSILDPDALEAPIEDGVTLAPIKPAAEEALARMKADQANFRVLTFFGSEEAARTLMAEVPGYDLIVVSGGYGEPTYRPQQIEGSETEMIVTGHKGMFVGLVGLYQDRPLKYARVALTHDFEDAPEMRQLMAEYQQQLKQLGLSGLGLSPIPHPSGQEFIGTEACGTCHTNAYEVWETSMHSEATAHIVEPTEGRGDVPRHFDPECLSCHVTGWNPQKYYPYESGYLSLEASAHLTGNGCENCHGPGAAHAAAEAEGSGVSDERKESLRLAMQLPLEKAKEHCMKCHDLDNSPDFHEEDAFEDIYWPQVEHYGVD
jgi:hypothetical protein